MKEGSVSGIEAWRLFVEKGEIAAEVRPEVAESWKRCRAAGVDPNLRSIPRLKPEEFKKRTAMRARFLEVMRDPMERLRRHLAGSGVMIGLFDLDGCQLSCMGDSKLMSLGAGLGFGEGAILREDVVGTSSVGLSLVTGKPSMCAPAEHYCLLLHHISGAATPVYDSSARMLGVIALYADSSVHPRHLFALVIEAVQNVMHEARVNAQLKWLQDYRRILTDLMGAPSNPMLVMDERGYVKHITPSALKLLHIEEPRALDEPIDRVARFTPPLTETLRNGKVVKDLQVEVGTTEGNFVSRVSGIPLRDPAGRKLGTLVVFQKSQSVRKGGSIERGTIARFTFDDIAGNSDAIVRAKMSAMRAAETSVNILLEGESGTGKEMFAQAIHNASDRRNGPFVTVNCAAIPSELIESELFGYRDGAFTGAKKGGMIGKFEAANGGTIFLDEICEMPLNMQSEILRVIENRCIVRVGEYEEIPVDIRIIAATNKKVLEEVEKGNFREDLYYRLSVTKITLPTLAERASDIPALVDAFIAQFNQQMGRNVKRIDESILDRFMTYDWPGNVRELKNAIEHAVMAAPGDTIGWEHLPDELRNALLYHRGPVLSRHDPLLDQKQAVAKMEKELEDGAKELYLKALEITGGNRTRAAKLLGIGRATLYRKLERFGLNTKNPELEILREEKADLDELSRELYLRALRKAKGNVTLAAKLLGVGRATFYRKLKQYKIGKRQLAEVRRQS